MTAADTNLRQGLVADAVEQVVQSAFPGKAASLCHVHAIVGANLASLAFDRAYRPVAGWGAIDCGAGRLVKLMDNDAFSSGVGGAYHCWIESTDQSLDTREVIDFSCRHNEEYVRKHNMSWNRLAGPAYVWGTYQDLVIDCTDFDLPSRIPDDRIWVRESEVGGQWMARHLCAHVAEYVKLTTVALKIYRAALDTVRRSVVSPAYSPA